MNTATLGQRIAQQNESAFRRNLFQRAIEDGLTIRVGESYLFFDGYSVRERKATQEERRRGYDRTTESEKK